MKAATPHRPRRSDDESGAVLILALIFMLTVSLVLVALLDWSGNDLINSANFRTSRSLVYATDGVADVAMYTARYNYPTTLSTAACPGASSMALDGETVTAWCSTALNANSSVTRVVTISACLSSVSQSSCLANPFLQASITFDDYSYTNTYHCTSVTDESTCGTGMTVTSWVVQ